MTPSFDARFPFSVSENNDDLEKHIMEFNKEKYEYYLDEFHGKIGLMFNGDASKRLVKAIKGKMERKDER